VRAVFIYNLRASTFDERVRDALEPAGYLLAPSGTKTQLHELAESVLEDDRLLVADNGNFKLIGKIAARHEGRARKLWEKIQAKEELLGRSVRTEDVPQSLRKKYRALADRIEDDARSAAGEGDLKLSEQVALRPNILIGVEDITMATWLASDIEPAYLALARAEYRKMNERIAKRAALRIEKLGPSVSKRYYPVASALSYDTAFDAGQAFAKAGIRKIAMGFGAFMADQNYVDHIKVRGKRIDFETRVSMRYLRTVAVACGFWDGYREEFGAGPLAFHFLGLGAPIILPLVALAAWGTRLISFDAMSPILDAVEGILYTTSPAYLKLRARTIARRLADEPGSAWQCPCPFCEDFEEERPSDPDLAARWAARFGAKAVVAADLKPPRLLAKAHPLLSEPSGGALRKSVDFARMGHNHWALERVLSRMRRNSKTKAMLRRHAERVVEAYAKKTSKPFAASMEAALELVSNRTTPA
jgi:hypothetical protein